ncbi:helix-turn-helix domain-containing protein [Shewanella donghaensis]|uniref:helix-turn-helix domain-containing protein n=1 Tax=Shewanella donghaensis TaxID=238836 RepID=UPI0013151703|nr:helix-turn-helix domain-containing protein [Shewanella donghaensis]
MHTKIVCEYCELINFPLPDEYHHYKYLSDTDLIGFNTITNLLRFIEKHCDNKYFFIDLLKYFNQRIMAFTQIDLSSEISDAQKLLAFTQFYNEVSDLNWSNVETDDSIGLVATRAPQAIASQYDDLFIYSCLTNILSYSSKEKSNIIIELPFERAFYGVNVDLFDKVTFNCQSMSVIVPKDERDFGSLSMITELSFSSVDRIKAAANSIQPSQLCLSNLANAIGVSERGLQRELKINNHCAKDMINKTRMNSIISILNKNNGNIKKSAYESGFKDLPSFSRYFSKSAGHTPSQYVKKHIYNNVQL